MTRISVTFAVDSKGRTNLSSLEYRLTPRLPMRTGDCPDFNRFKIILVKEFPWIFDIPLDTIDFPAIVGPPRPPITTRRFLIFPRPLLRGCFAEKRNPAPGKNIFPVLVYFYRTNTISLNPLPDACRPVGGWAEQGKVCGINVCRDPRRTRHTGTHTQPHTT